MLVDAKKPAACGCGLGSKDVDSAAERLESLVHDPLLIVLGRRRALLDALVGLLELLVDQRDEVLDRHRARYEPAVDEEARSRGDAELPQVLHVLLDRLDAGALH